MLKDYFDTYTGNYVIPFGDYKENEDLRAEAHFFLMNHTENYTSEFEDLGEEKFFILIEKSNL